MHTKIWKVLLVDQTKINASSIFSMKIIQRQEKEEIYYYEIKAKAI